MINRKVIGARIRYHRIKNEISQEELAFQAQISRVHIGYIERGERAPSLETLINIANILEISADELIADNLLVFEPKVSVDEIDVLEDCTTEECSIILQNMISLKEIIRKYHITK